jgi:prepilin-type N-terminal cleavage/methylation domain-containing protein
MTKKQKNLKYSSGFTLIELLTVVAIIALLASLVLVALHNAQKKGRDAKRLADLKQVDTAIQEYVQDNGHAPYLGVNNCSAANVSSCMAYDYDSGTWGGLATDLSPYVKALPHDPCGQKCGGDGWFSYAYKPPANMAQMCQSQSCGLNTERLNYMYAIYAETMEITGTRSSGFNHGFAESF